MRDVIPERDLVENSRSPVSPATGYHPVLSLLSRAVVPVRNWLRVVGHPSNRPPATTPSQPPLYRSVADKTLRSPALQPVAHNCLLGCPTYYRTATVPQFPGYCATSSARKCFNLNRSTKLPRPTGRKGLEHPALQLPAFVLVAGLSQSFSGFSAHIDPCGYCTTNWSPDLEVAIYTRNT